MEEMPVGFFLGGGSGVDLVKPGLTTNKWCLSYCSATATSLLTFSAV